MEKFRQNLVSESGQQINQTLRNIYDRMVLDQGVINFSFKNARSAMGRSRMANFPHCQQGKVNCSMQLTPFNRQQIFTMPLFLTETIVHTYS